MKFQSYSQILSVVVYVTNFNMCNFIIITFSALKLQVALYFRNRLAPSVNIESRTVTLWHLVKKKYYTVRIFQSLSRNLVYAFNKDHSGVKKKTRKVMHAWKSLIYQKYCKIDIFFFIYMYYMYYPASWMSPVHIVHISRATNIQNQSKDMFFFPLGYAMIL